MPQQLRGIGIGPYQPTHTTNKQRASDCTWSRHSHSALTHDWCSLPSHTPSRTHRPAACAQASRAHRSRTCAAQTRRALPSRDRRASAASVRHSKQRKSPPCSARAAAAADRLTPAEVVNTGQRDNECPHDQSDCNAFLRSAAYCASVTALKCKLQPEHRHASGEQTAGGWLQQEHRQPLHAA